MPKQMNKASKVKMINEALQKSSVAKGKRARAFLDEKGRLRYEMLAQSATGPYLARATFQQMLNLMHGKDMREVYRAVHGDYQSIRA